MEKKWKWGILGTARIAQKAFIPGLLRSTNGTLHAIAGRKHARISEFEKAFSPGVSYTSYEELLKDRSVEAVYIPLPNALHKGWAIKAMESGKHVLCEKPLGLNPAEVEEMTRVSREQGVVLMEAFAYIHNPLIQEMKSELASGKIGTMHSMVSTFSFDLNVRPEDIRWVRELGGGAMYDLGCYTIHLSRFFAGSRVQKVEALGKCTPDEQIDASASVILEFENGISSHFNVSFEQAYRTRFEVQGTEGAIFTNHPFNESGNLTWHLLQKGGQVIREVASPDNYFLEAQHFGEVLSGKIGPKISLEDSLENARVIQHVLEKIGYGE